MKCSLIRLPGCARHSCTSLDRCRPARLEINRAVNVEALTPAGLLDGQIVLGLRPAADGTRRVRRMHSVHKQHCLVGTKRIQKVLVGFDEPLLLLHIELAPDRFRLAVFEIEPMQQGDEPCAALIDDAKFAFDISADLACRARRRKSPSGLLDCMQLICAVRCGTHGPSLILESARRSQSRDPVWICRATAPLVVLTKSGGGDDL